MFSFSLSYKYFSNKKLNLSQIDLDNFIDVKGWKSIGNKIINDKIRSGSFKLLERKEIKKIEKDKKEISEEKKENFDVGESIDLDLDSDQLNLFNEKN